MAHKGMEQIAEEIAGAIIEATEHSMEDESLGDCDISLGSCRHRLVEAIEIALMDIQDPKDLTHKEHLEQLRKDEQEIGWALLHLIRFHSK